MKLYRGIRTEIGESTHCFKLLKAQLITYIKGDKVILLDSANKRLRQLNKLHSSGFGKIGNVTKRVFTDFASPYSGSFVAEPTDLEHETLFISQLEDSVTLPLLSSTVIKDNLEEKYRHLKSFRLFLLLDAIRLCQ
jgi:hypothetical protein